MDRHQTTSEPKSSSQNSEAVFSRFIQSETTTDSQYPYSSEKSIQCTLSMGHKIHILSYNPSSNVIEVVQYVTTFAQINDSRNTQIYNYMLWSPLSQKYEKVVQNFTKYGNDRFSWSYLDNLICGDPHKTFTEGTRFRRNMFCIIPEHHADLSKELEYVQKFQRLLEYISKLQQKELQHNKVDVKILTSQSFEQNEAKKGEGIAGSTWRKTLDDAKHLIVPLRKGNRGKFEWLEIVLDSIFDSRKTYRITIQWLVATSKKVEAQIQLLQRRCSQYGLNLVSINQNSFTDNPSLHPFLAPPCIPVRDKEKASMIEKKLTDFFGFVNDGIRFTSQTFLEGIHNFDFGRGITRDRKRQEMVCARQYIHFTGCIFMRVLNDNNGWALFLLIENRKFSREKNLDSIAKIFFDEFNQFIESC